VRIRQALACYAVRGCGGVGASYGRRATWFAIEFTVFPAFVSIRLSHVTATLAGAAGMRVVLASNAVLDAMLAGAAGVCVVLASNAVLAAMLAGAAGVCVVLASNAVLAAMLAGAPCMRVVLVSRAVLAAMLAVGVTSMLSALSGIGDTG